MLSKRLLAPALILGAVVGLQLPQTANAQWFNAFNSDSTESTRDNFKPINVDSRVASNTVGVRLWDYWKYLPKVVEDLANVEAALSKSPERFLGTQVKEVYNLFLRSGPTVSGQTYKLPLTYFIRDGADVLRFVKVDIIYTSSADMRAIPRGSVLLSSTNFRVDVALVDRKAIVSDSANDITMVFPLGVGSFDVGVLHDSVSLLTPRFEEGYLDKRTLIYKREKPRYYADKPFIRITTKRDDLEAGWTGIGFHAQPNLATFVRAFDSHGCMRMQLADLYTLYWIVEGSPRQQTPVSVSYHMDTELSHPFPKRDMPWRQVNNIGSDSAPMYNLDRDGLTEAVLEWKYEAPIAELVDQAGDNYHDLYDYDMDWREKERMARHEQMCREKFLGTKELTTQKLFGIGRSRDQRDYEKCVKDGRRSVDLGDRLYRFWVH